MTMVAWISMNEACRILGVRSQTVYAYVSRGKLEVMPDPGDTRRSLYRAEDVAGLAKRKQDGRKHETLAAKTLFVAITRFIPIARFVAIAWFIPVVIPGRVDGPGAVQGLEPCRGWSSLVIVAVVLTLL